MNTMNYEASMGACGPVGCAPPAYGYPYGYPAAAYGAAPYFGGDVVRTDIIGRQAVPAHAPAQVGSMTHWDIIGQNATPAPAPAEGSWLQQPGPLGVKRLYWGLGAAAIGLTWLAWSQGWFGGILGGGRGRDFDGVAGDFYF